jgi:hypothetical protein
MQNPYRHRAVRRGASYHNKIGLQIMGPRKRGRHGLSRVFVTAFLDVFVKPV